MDLYGQYLLSVVLASQVLTLLDAFIFPNNLDMASKAASQLHRLALVRSTEPRLGQSQGTLLESTDFDETSNLDPFAWARKFMWAEGEHFVHNFESVVIVSPQTVYNIIDKL